MAGNNYVSNSFFDSDRQISRSVSVVQQRPINSDDISRFQMMAPPSLKPKTIESSFGNVKNNSSNVDTVPTLPMFYHLESTNFHSCQDCKSLIDLIRKFLLHQEIHFQLKPNKCKFKCTDRMNNTFVIRLFRDESGSIITEVQHRSGCPLRFRLIFNQLKNELTSPQLITSTNATSTTSNIINPTEHSLCMPKLEELNETSANTFESNLLRINTSLETELYDTQEILISQLLYELNNSKNIVINSNIIAILKSIEVKIHQMINNYYEIKLMIQLNQLIIALNLIYDILNESNESVDYKKTIEILAEIICSMTQSIFICQSIANLFQKLLIICPNNLTQNQIRNKLYLSIAKQSTRETFQNSIQIYQKQIQNILQSISVK